jgi:hypothetical protein
MEEIYHDANATELAELWGTTKFAAEQVMHQTPFMHELLKLIHYSGLDFGIVIRDPAANKEVTFFAENNLSGEPGSFSQVSTEIVDYGSDKKGDSHDGKGIDFLSRVNPFDPAFDLKAALGEDTIEAEFQEVDRRDLQEAFTPTISKGSLRRIEAARQVVGSYVFVSQQAMLDDRSSDGLCEDCLDHAKIPDSHLCYFCTMKGSEILPESEGGKILYQREEGEVENQELRAKVIRHAQETNEHSLRLLKAAGLLTEHQGKDIQDETDV